MDKPVLKYDGIKLLLEFPGWTRKQVDAVREHLVCWRLKPNTGNILEAEFTMLAQWEVKETFPQLIVMEDTRTRIRQESYLRTKSLVSGPPFPELKPVQKEPATLLWQRERALLTAAPGLGKTVMALVALAEKSFDLAVIVVPLTSLDGWEEEIRKWLTPTLPDFLFLKWRDKEAVVSLPDEHPSPVIVLTTPNVIGKIQEMQTEYGQGLDSVFYDRVDRDTFLILDESFMYQNRKAGRTNVIEELALYFRTIWQLSGMPVSTVNDDLFTQLRILYPKTFRSYWKFARRYCLIESSYWGDKVVGNRPDSEELLRRDLEDILIPCEYPDNVPDWIPETVDCPMTDAQEKLYAEAKAEMALLGKPKKSKKSNTQDPPLTKSRMIVLTSRLRQIASNPVTYGGINESGKWDKFLSLVGQYPKPALVWVKYTATAKLIYKALAEMYPQYRLGSITGATKQQDRYTQVQQFQAGQMDILLLNDGVGKYSLTLTAAKVAYYLERDFNGEAYYQSLFRARRITSEHPVRIVLFRSTHQDGKPTIDHLVHKALLERSQNAQRLTMGELIGSC